MSDPVLQARTPAPANSLPTWDECSLRVHNSDYIAKRVAEGGYGPEAISKTATELHRFIYEYDDRDPYRSAWFLHRLELLLNEVRRTPSPVVGVDAAQPVAWLKTQLPVKGAPFGATQAAMVTTSKREADFWREGGGQPGIVMEIYAPPTPSNGSSMDALKAGSAVAGEDQHG